MADGYQRNRFNRSERWEDPRSRGRGERDWRQQEQFSGEQRPWSGEEQAGGYGQQMSDPYGHADYGRRQGAYEASWDRDESYGGGGRGGDYRSSGEYNYGPAHYESGTGRRAGSFTSEDQAGHDFISPGANRGYRHGAPGANYGAAGYGAGAASRHQYDHPDHDRGWFERAGDEVASWFGDEEAARRREADHTGRGPSGYTRSDERILEDACDELTDDWAVDARNIQVTVKEGEITLDGTVPTRQQKRRAEDCVEDISGVRHVQNNLRVQESSDWDRSDDAARAEGQRTTGSLT